MFNVNSTFYQFLTAVQNKLGAEFDLHALAENACLLQGTGIPVSLVYYLTGAGNRIPVKSDTRCIHLDEDTWLTQPTLLLSRIAALAGQAQRVHARETVTARVDKPVAMAFQQAHHLQVALPGKYRYGLFHQGELVAVAVFSGGRKMDGEPADYRSFELLRFCHKQGVHVVGGLGKLMDAFEQEFNPGDIMTYADRDWSDGNSYRKTGFAIVGEVAPQRFWVDTQTMQRYAEHTLPDAIREKTDEERLRKGYKLVCNSGSFKLVRRRA